MHVRECVRIRVRVRVLMRARVRVCVRVELCIVYVGTLNIIYKLKLQRHSS